MLASFNVSDGALPFAPLRLSADGKTLYGTTECGGIYGTNDGDIGLGTVFSIPVTGGAPTVLASFIGGTNGANPSYGLSLSADGKTLYGTTSSGGTSDNGTVFSLSLSGTNSLGATGTKSQSISFAQPATKVFGAPSFNLSASASSKLPVSFTSSDNSVATITGSNTVSIVGVGSTTITATQSGNETYAPAVAVSKTLTVNQASQKIAFVQPSAHTFTTNGSFTLAATAPGGTVSFSSGNSNILSITDSTATINGAGTTTITANQAGNSNYLAASPLTRNVTVKKASQTISPFAPISPVTYGAAPFSIILPNSTSGLPVSVTVASGPASISSNTVTITGAGTVKLSASQSGDSNYNAAPTITKSFSVAKTKQTIAFMTPASESYSNGATFNLSASATSGGTVHFTSSKTNVISISGTTATINGKGTTSITASSAATADYNAATPVAISVRVY